MNRKVRLIVTTLVLSICFIFTAYAKECSVTYKGKPITENSEVQNNTGNNYYWLILNGYTKNKIDLGDFLTSDNKKLSESGKTYYEIGINNIPELVENTDGSYNKKSSSYGILRVESGKKDGKLTYDYIYISKLPVGVNPRLLGQDKKYVVDTREDIKYNDFKTNETGKWYERHDGTYPTDTWEKIEGEWYKFNSEGYVITGWIGEEIYEDTTGEVKDTTYYYSNSEGIMQTGWLEIEDKWYYLEEDGKMFKDGTTPDGFTVGVDGTSLDKAEAEKESEPTENSDKVIDTE